MKTVRSISFGIREGILVSRVNGLKVLKSGVFADFLTGLVLVPNLVPNGLREPEPVALAAPQTGRYWFLTPRPVAGMGLRSCDFADY